MRRPPDRDGHPGMSESDVESSNATLNTLFGGARQKSWLLGPHPPVRPTPRHTTSNSSENHATLAQKTSVTVLPSPAPSDEASPNLSHSSIAGGGMRYQNDRQLYSNENQRPRVNVAQYPPPMLTRPSEAVIRPSPITQTQSWIPPSLLQRRESRPTFIDVNSLPSISAPAVPPSPSTTAQSLADGQATFRSAQELRSPSLPPQSSRSARHPFANTAHSINETTERAPEVLIQQASREQLLSPSPVPASPPTMTFDQPPLPTSVLIPTQINFDPKPSSIPSNPHKRQRIQVPAPSLKGRLALIDAHIQSVGGAQYLNNDLERPRFQLLSEACKNEDTFYVVLHQLFCIWDSPGRVILESLHDFPATTILTIAFKVLGHLIRDNSGLAPNHLKWFADFPSPLVDLMRTSEAYQRVVKNVAQFLGKLASDWAALSRACTSRGYPPLVDELINRMGLISPILQHIMFTATRRNLGVEDDMYGEQMEKVFGEDKQGHQELAARFNTGRPPTEKEIIERNQVLIDKYLSIYNARIRSSRRSGSAMVSPVTHSPVVPQAIVQRHTSMNNNDASVPSQPQNVNFNESQSFPNPDPWHQNHQIQQSRPTSNSSPNTLLQAVAGHPSTEPGYRSYSNAPSPTLQQGFSMIQPPIQQQQGSQWPGPTPVVRSNGYQVQNLVAGQPGVVPLLSSQQHQRVMQQQHQQAMMQQLTQHLTIQQQQLSAAQQHHQPQVTMQQQPQITSHWQHGTQPMHPHAQAHLQLQNYPQQGQRTETQQHQQMEQPRQQIPTPRVLSVNRAAYLRNSSEIVDVQQHVHPRNNSVSSTSRPPANSHSPSLPRPIPTFIPSPIIQDQVIQMYNNNQPLQRNLVPPLAFQQLAQPTDPDMTALHQAHLRSPRLVTPDLSSDVTEDDPSRRYYQFVKSLAMPPIKIPFTSTMSYFEFSVPSDDYALISKNKMVGTDRVPVREFKRGSLQYRLRCIQSKRDTSKCLTPEWIISDTVWPETVFVEINSHQLEVRRKNHHGKDLPIDITQHIVPKISPGNINRVKVSIPRLRKAMKDTSYFIAVEVVEVLQHHQIMEKITQTQHITAFKSLDAIKKSLAPPPTDDDDFAMVVSDLSIDLADPFTARIFEIPVRGDSCLHRECFDLETFLITRNSKPKRPKQPSMIDVWKCPLCGKDARPYSLKVDDFLASVRGELAALDKLDTRAILISADGSWRARPEARPMKRKATDDLDDDDAKSSDGEGTARRQQVIGRRNNPHLNGGRARREVEVIELDD